MLRKAGSLVEAEVIFLTHGYIVGNSSLPPIPPQAALFLSEAQWGAAHALLAVGDVFNQPQHRP